MITLNDLNGASFVLGYYQTQIIHRFEKGLVGVEMGIAYGGGVESLGSIWKGRGIVYGYDTFEDLHPDFLSKDKFSTEARCMDRWYSNDIYGTKALSYDFQRSQLDAEGLSNVILRKGLVAPDSCKDIEKIHYAFLDMDILESMRNGYEAVKDKIVKGGFLFLHDVVPENHLIPIYEWCKKDVITDPRWKIEGRWDNQYLLGLERI